jgi:hypothetical protein
MAKTRVHKKFFEIPSKKIMKDRVSNTIDPKDAKLLEIILNLREDETILINAPMVPENWRTNSGRYFLKNPINDVKASWDMNVAQIIRRGTIPLDFRLKAFEKERKGEFVPRSGYSFTPLRPGINIDSRVRRISLVECLEGARMAAYVDQVKMVHPIKIDEYLNAQKVLVEGAIVPFEVPSRSKKIPRYKFRFESVAVNPRRSKEEWRKFAIGWKIKTDHSCERKRWHINYMGGTSSREFIFCAHEAVAYREFAKRMWQNGNKNPMVMSQFVQPSDLAIELYKRALDSVLVYDELLKSKDKLRNCSKADLEILAWRLNYEAGPEAATFREPTGKQLEKVDWSLRYIQ